jgi:hypothetical protein
MLASLCDPMTTVDLVTRLPVSENCITCLLVAAIIRRTAAGGPTGVRPAYTGRKPESRKKISISEERWEHLGNPLGNPLIDLTPKY